MKNVLLLIPAFILVPAIAFQSSNPFHSSSTSSVSRAPSLGGYADFHDFTVQFVDAQSSQPIQGLFIEAMCSGGTPYRNRFDTTDVNGFATIAFGDPEIADVIVRTSDSAQLRRITRSDPIVRLDHRELVLSRTKQ